MPFILLTILIMAGCKKTNSTDNSSEVQASSFGNLTFDAYDYGAVQFFSSFDTSFKTPLPQYSMSAAQIKNVDLMFIYNTDQFQPGFIDPVTASKHWYWDDYYSPWLDSSVQTNFYITTLDVESFNAAGKNPSLLSSYFKDSTKVRLAPNPVFPAGTCIGGRLDAASNDPVFGIDTHLAKDEIFGFKNVKSGKVGLIHISPNQENGWPAPIMDHNTKVDIVKEK